MSENMREKMVRNDRIQRVVCVILGICASLLLTASIVQNRMMSVEAKVSETQEHLAKEVLRFHVLANSDSDEDQRVKLLVRDAVLAYMREDMSREYGDQKMTAELTRQWAKRHLAELKDVAEQTLLAEGYFYGAKAEVTTCYFPEKRYGDITFPKGYYEALRIELGRAAGHNWWCVLYPNLCFTDATTAVVSDEGKEELGEALTEDEYEMVTATSDFKIRCFFFGGNTDSD